MQLFKTLAWSTVNPSKHTTPLKRTLFGKSHQFRALTKKEENRAAVLNFSCFKISLKGKKKTHLTEAVYFRKHSDNWPALLYSWALTKACGCEGGGQHTATGLTQHGHPGPRTWARMSRGAPTTVLCWRIGPEGVATHLLFWNQNPRWLL